MADAVKLAAQYDTPIIPFGVGSSLEGHLLAVQGGISIDLGRNATIVIELAVGLAVGMAAQTARRAHAELERATRLAASLQERERLSRQVHDGAIQVLALVARKGREIGGDAAQLAELAGEQERALRRLVSAGREDHAVNVSRVRFGALDAAAIATYVAGGEWQGKAGAYGIQGRAAAFVEHLEGSYTGVMGLPLYETAALLRRFGIGG